MKIAFCVLSPTGRTGDRRLALFGAVCASILFACVTLPFLAYAWDLSTAFFPSASVVSQEADSRGLFFSSDGTKMYVIGVTNDTVYQYTLSTPWSASTASYDSVSFSVASQDGSPQGLAFSSDGTKMYIVGATNNTVYQYTLSTPWSLASASYDSVSFSMGGPDFSRTDIFFKSDGTKMYIVGSGTDTVYQYTLSTPWSVSSASYDSVSFSVATQENSPGDLFFKSDGTKMYVVGSQNDTVYQYTLSTPWSVSSASYDSVSFSVATQDGFPTSLFFKPDGTQMYMVGIIRNTVYQYALSSAWSLASASFPSASVAGQDNSPASLFFKEDGTKMYVMGTTNDTVYQYTLSTPWSVSSASYDSVSFSVATQENTPSGLFFSSDGTKMYVLGTQNDTVYQYTLSSPWTLSSASYSGGSFSVTSQDGLSKYLFFSPDGAKMYMVGTVNNIVYQYTLSTPWSVSSASYDSVSFSVTTQDNNSTGLFFKEDGTKMYVLGSQNDAVYQYTLSTPWSLASASYDSVSFSVAGQDTLPAGLFFQPDGGQMYVTGATLDIIFGYFLDSPFVAAPTNLSLTLNTASITLDWDAPEVEDVPDPTLINYAIYRDTSSPASSLLATIGTTTTTYQDSAVLAGVKYYYRVTASDDTATSTFSNEVSTELLSPRVIRLRGGTRLVGGVRLGGSSPVIGGGGGGGGEWIDSLPAQTFNADDSSWTSYTVRQTINQAALVASGDTVRLTLTGPASVAGSTITSMYIGHQAAAGDAYDFDGGQVQVTVGGNGAFTVGTGATVVTDEMPFSLDETKNLVISWGITSPGSVMRQGSTNANFQVYYRSINNDTATTDTSGYSTWDQALFLVSRIEVES